MKPNDKVVCVDDNFHQSILNPAFRFVGPLPKKNSVYTVEKALMDDEGVRSLRLTGATVFFAANRGEIETGFRVIRFRKLDEVKQDASNHRLHDVGQDAALAGSGAGGGGLADHVL